MKKTKCFAGDIMDNQWYFMFCVKNHGLLKNLWEWEILVFDKSTDNSIIESLGQAGMSHFFWIMLGQVLENKWNKSKQE